MRASAHTSVAIPWIFLGNFRGAKTRATICCPLTGVTTLAGDYPAGVSGTSRVFCWRMANGLGYQWYLYVQFRFSCMIVLHAANVGIMDLYGLWCVLDHFTSFSYTTIFWMKSRSSSGVSA